MDPEKIRASLSDLQITQIRYFDEIGSTNDEALNWLESGAVEYSLVVADSQTKGRGRFDRKWITNPGSGLAFSIIIKPRENEMRRLSLFAPLGALAVARALEEAFGLSPQIKWPNDVLLVGKKACGILAEASWNGASLKGVVLGIGVNISKASLSPTLLAIFPPTCVEEVYCKPIDRELFLMEILRNIINLRQALTTPEFLSDWQEHLALKNEHVMLENGDGNSVVGRLRGVAPDGSLEIELDDGTVKHFLIGDVRLKPAGTKREV